MLWSMQVKCLSILNPTSYLVAAGIKTVENRTWSTDYRGWLYIHSSGDRDYAYYGAYDVPDLAAPSPQDAPYDHLTPSEQAAYRLYRHACEWYGADLSDPKIDVKAILKSGCLMVSHSIIGRVRIVDVVRDSQDPFAEAGCYHWLLADAELWRRPLTQINGHLRLWTFDLPKAYTTTSLV